MSVAVAFDHVSKQFTLHHSRPHSFQEMLLHLFHPGKRHNNGWGREQFWALRDISFEIAQGETAGLIGPNGAGKSTALKMMARILEPTSGRITVNGRVSALLELGAGFHPDLTGRENVYLNGTLLGLSQQEMRVRFDDIVAFSGLERFIDMPVKHYSSGMYMRLGFSIAIHVAPDILLVDEVLAVGDQAFQTKCMERIYDLKRQGITIVIVSHALETLRTLCSRLIWIEHSDLRAVGPSDEVAAKYLRHFQIQENERLLQSGSQIDPGQRWGSGEVEITGVRFLDARGEERKAFQTGDAMTVEISYRAHEPVDEPVIGLAIYRQDGTHINGPNTRFGGLRLGRVSGSGTVKYHIPYLPLLAGTFDLSVTAYDLPMLHPFDHQHRAYTFQVVQGGSRELYGIFEVPGEWAHEANGRRQEGTPWPVRHYPVAAPNGHH
ncbi:MAG: ABC transporter ATP-binding protein [Ardenticatenaceae bacterium]|nr:ABC transporter ATP-binding protein [Ardenticatenaceae bacterium]HBY97182.1 ABC transporter ATP-binding protein [Chloroflexota bacterium]